MIYGYARVSTGQQSLDVQIDALRQYGCNTIFSEKISGSGVVRPELDALLERIKPNDAIVIHRLDRLGRSLHQLVGLMAHFEKHGIRFVSLCDCIDTTTAVGRLLYHVLASIAHFERDLISDRTKLGLAAAKKRGSVLGRPRGITKPIAEKLILCQKLVKGAESVTAACQKVGVSRPTFYKYQPYFST